MHLHSVYGLSVASEIPLPELVVADFDRAAVTIRLGRIGRTCPKTTPVMFDIGARVAHLAWSEVGAFRVEEGRTIVADLRQGVPDDLARLPLLGAVLAVLLHQRGFLVLHGSAVAIANQAVIFVGSKGAGKSTMAAALFACGHRLIADDVVAVDCTSDRGPKVAPGYPQLKLSPAAARIVLKGEFDALPRIHRRSEKRCRRVGEGGFAAYATCPGRVYALVRGQACKSTPVTAQEALTTLLQHSYMTRFGSQVLSGAAAGSHLRQCSALAKRAPVHRLEVLGDLRGLDRAAHFVEEDLGCALPTVSAESESAASHSGRASCHSGAHSASLCLMPAGTLAPGTFR
jgi:hypothetical protein